MERNYIRSIHVYFLTEEQVLHRNNHLNSVFIYVYCLNVSLSLSIRFMEIVEPTFDVELNHKSHVTSKSFHLMGLYLNIQAVRSE